MNSSVIRYPKIGALKSVVYEVNRRMSYDGEDAEGNPVYKDRSEALPTLTFEGTVKLHGINVGIQLSEGAPVYQSRNRILTPNGGKEKDPHGFATEMAAKDWSINPLEYTPTVIYGEYCGGNIQSKVAIAELPRMLVTFNHRLKGENIYYIKDFTTFHMEIDMSNPSASVEKLQALTQAVEDECPVAAALGVKGTGEGIVWRCLTAGWQDLVFKVKGEKHSKSKVKTLNVANAQAQDAAFKFASGAMTEERLQQGWDYLTEMGLPHEKRNVGVLLNYVVRDCLEEEKLNIVEQNINPKLAAKAISTVTKDWFFNRIAVK